MPTRWTVRGWAAPIAACVAAALALAGCMHEGTETPERRVAGGDPDRGQVVIERFGCGSCHVIPGIPGATGRVGPSLEAFADRHYIAGSLPNHSEFLVRWLLEPGEIEPGTAMPDVGLDPAQARDAAAYLYTIEGLELGPPHPLPKRWLEALRPGDHGI